METLFTPGNRVITTSSGPKIIPFDVSVHKEGRPPLPFGKKQLPEWFMPCINQKGAFLASLGKVMPST